MHVLERSATDIAVGIIAAVNRIRAREGQGLKSVVKSGGMKLRFHVERAAIKVPKFSRLGGKRCKLR